MAGVETYVAGGAGTLRYDVRGRVADIEGGKLHGARLEEIRAVIQRILRHVVHQTGQRMHGVDGLLRISGMALHPLALDEQVE